MMLFIMHHIVLCTPCIVLVIDSHLLYMRVDHTEPKSEFQAEQVQWAFGGPQASSYEEANIVVINASPGASHQSSCLLYLKLYLEYYLIVH
jgi:hypothetical protein